MCSCALWVGMALPAAAQEEPDTSALMDLAQRFADRVSKKYDEIDAFRAGLSKEDIRLQEYFDTLEDGEVLVLEVKLSKHGKNINRGLQLNLPVTAIKQGQDVMISLYDFVSVAGFAIRIAPEENKAEGWFASEDNKFLLDLSTGTVTAGQISRPLQPGEVEADAEDILVSGKTLSEWFNCDIRANLQSQRLQIVADNWPLQKKLARMEKRKKADKKNTAELPFDARPQHIVSLPRLDVTARHSFDKPDGSPGNNASTYSINGTGDLLAHSADLTMNGNDQTPVSNVRLTLYKESDKKDLLGPLRASRYELNDVRGVNVPMAGNTPVQRGVRVTNKTPGATQDTVTNIEGFGPVGWDVELYRDRLFIGGAVIDDSGTYSFNDVPLNIGVNPYRVVLYGPLGERREEDKSITASQTLRDALTGIYDISITQQNETTYRHSKSKDVDKGTPRFDATFRRQITDKLTLNTGTSIRQEEDQTDLYFYTGASIGLDKTLLNADLVTTSDGPWQAVASARRMLGNHNALFSARYASEDFSSRAIIPGVVNTPAYYALVFGLNGQWLPNVLEGASYDFTLSTRDADNGVSSQTANFAVASQFMGMSFNNAISANHSKTPTAQNDTVVASTSASGRLWGNRWRSSLGYSLVPDMQLSTLTVNVDRTISDNLSLSAETKHRFEDDLSEASLAASYSMEKARISPSISYDSENNFRADVRVNFGLAMDPHTHDVVMSSKQLSNMGGVSALVFLDKDGDGVFNNDDEPLPDVYVKASQVNRGDLTDEKGEVFIHDLPTNRVTDITVDATTSFDPAWVIGWPGVSIRPRPGDTMRIEFPVLRGAEIDGTAYIQEPDGGRHEARNIDLLLTTPDGTVAKQVQVPTDGFYYIESLHPGVYYMTSDTSMSPIKSYLLPRRVVVTHEGGVYYGRNVTLFKGYEIPFRFSARNQNPAETRRTKIATTTDIEKQDVYIRLGNYRSQLAMTLAWYKLQIKARNWANPVDLVTQLKKIEPDDKTNLMPLLLKTEQPISIEDAAAMCENLQDAGFKECGVDIVTTFRNADGTTAELPPAEGENVNKINWL